MSRIMTIWLPRWPVQRRLLERPELRRRPVFVCRRERRGVMTVVAWAWATPPRRAESSLPQPIGARLARIPSGMSLAEAMAVLALAHGSRACHIAEVEHDDPMADLASLEQLARYCRRFAPIVSIEKTLQHDPMGPECLQIDVTGTAGFFGGEGPLVRTVVWTLASRGMHARAAIADTPAASWAAVHHTDALLTLEKSLHARSPGSPERMRQDLRGCRRRRWAIVPAGTQMQSLAGLPAAALRLDDAVLTQLRDVGIDTIGDVFRLPRKSLASRFAPQLALRLTEFSGIRPEPLSLSCPEELPAASRSFDFPLMLRDTTLDEIINVIERLLQDCVATLKARGKGVMSLQVRLERPQSVDLRGACPPTIVDVGVFQPSNSARHLAELVRLRMARMRMPREIEGITVEVVSAGVAECRQRMLFGEESETSVSQVAMLLDRLSGRLGRGAVFEPRPMADAQPEYAWSAVPPAASRFSRPIFEAKQKIQTGRGAGSKRSHRDGMATAVMMSRQRRPIWLLPRPLRLETISVVNGVPEQHADATRCPLVRFRLPAPTGSQSNFQTHEVLRADGPERIETAWWRGPTVRRDYYVVETTSGARYWIFRRLRAGRADRSVRPGESEWFLHGTFA